MRHFFPLLLTAALMLSASAAMASDNLNSDLQQWSVVTFEGPRDQKLRGYLEIQPRLKEGLTGIQRILVRPAVIYEPKKNWTVGLGYGWITTFDQREQIDEHRIWQQLRHVKPLSRWSVENRLRTEQRFIEKADGVTHRARHQIRVTRKIGDSERWYLAGYNELFVNLDDPDGGSSAGYDQNRLYLGIGRQLSKPVRAEVGYLQNHLRVADSTDPLNHAVVLQLQVSF
ncbi:MAG: DUF2490 domain-containing protein [Candidatus Melainabacteria bacterium]